MNGRYSSPQLLWSETEHDETTFRESFEKLMGQARGCRQDQPIRYLLAHQKRKEGPMSDVYVWFCKKCLDVRNVLLGLNPDGSERRQYVDDPNWESSEEAIKKLEQQRDAWQEELDDPATTDWGMIGDLEDWIAVNEAKIEAMKNGTPPKVSVKLGPLLPHDFVFMEAWARSPPVGHVGNQLIVAVPPQEVVHACATEANRLAIARTARATMIPFVSDAQASRPRHDHRSNTQIVEQYPIVNVTAKGKIYITFEPETNDAAFALLMYKNGLKLNAHASVKLWYVRIETESKPKRGDHSQRGKKSRR